VFEKPTEDEQMQGVVAICIATESVRQYDRRGQFTGLRGLYLRRYRYTEAQLDRYIQRTGNRPEWMQDTSEAWLQYIATGKVTAEIEARLQTLGSYAA
jgi:hypothetical protein